MVNDFQSAGYKSIRWDAIILVDSFVGMYIYTIHAGDFRQTMKMILLNKILENRLKVKFKAYVYNRLISSRKTKGS